MAWIQMPAEAIKVRLALDPFDFRLDHAISGLLHFGYLLPRSTSRWSTSSAGPGPPWRCLPAPSPVTCFFHIGPFVSHDLAPGALLLWMVIWSEDFARSPRWPAWLLLVAAGAIAPLVKQTYGVFWIAVLVAHGLPLLIRPGSADRSERRTLVWLVAGAATSGLITWTVYGLVLRTWVPNEPLWLRPYYNLQYLGHVYDGTDTQFPLWIYLRNLWAYGRLTTLADSGLVVLPGWIAPAATRGHRVMTVVVFLHLLPLREVRYFALAAAGRVRRRTRGAGDRPTPGRLLLMVGCWCWISAGPRAEASRIGKPFYRRNELRALLEPISSAGAPRKATLSQRLDAQLRCARSEPAGRRSLSPDLPRRRAPRSRPLSTTRPTRCGSFCPLKSRPRQAERRTAPRFSSRTRSSRTAHRGFRHRRSVLDRSCRDWPTLQTMAVATPARRGVSDLAEERRSEPAVDAGRDAQRRRILADAETP